MAYEVREFVVVVANTATKAAPQVTDLLMPARVVREIRVRIPPGPRGEVGWLLGSGGQQIVPTNAGGWIVGNDETIAWVLQGQLESGAWQLIAYNTGTFSHTLYVQFLVDPPQLAAVALSPALMPLSAAAIMG
jgi:hypothetical protein